MFMGQKEIFQFPNNLHNFYFLKVGDKRLNSERAFFWKSYSLECINTEIDVNTNLKFYHMKIGIVEFKFNVGSKDMKLKVSKDRGVIRQMPEWLKVLSEYCVSLPDKKIVIQEVNKAVLRKNYIIP